MTSKLYANHMVFGLLAGIAVARNKNWSGWGRFALLLLGMYNLATFLAPLALTGDIEPTLLTESIWIAIWFLVGLAFYQASNQEKTDMMPPEQTSAWLKKPSM